MKTTILGQNGRILHAPMGAAHLPRLLAVLALCFCPAVASAQVSVTLVNGKLVVSDTIDTADQIIVGEDNLLITVTSALKTIIAGSDINQLTPNMVSVSKSLITDGMTIDLSDGSDFLRLDGPLDFSATGGDLLIQNVETCEQESAVTLGSGNAEYDVDGTLTFTSSASLVAGTGNITLNAQTLHHSGALGSGTMSGDILLNIDEADLSSGTIQTDGTLEITTLTPGRDIEVGGTKNSAFLGLDSSDLDSLRGGFNQIIIGDVNTGALTLGSYDFGDDTQLNGEVIEQSGSVAMGNDSLTVNAGDRIELTNTASLSSGRGNLTLNATQSTSPTAILLDGANLLSLSGTITLNGQSEGTNAQRGISLQGGTLITSVVSAPIFLNGEVRESETSQILGITIDNSPNVIQSFGSGQISLTGSVSGSSNITVAIGILIDQTNTVQATDTGEISLTGTVSADNVPAQRGIQFGGSVSAPSSTGIEAKDGDIVVNGSASGTGSGNEGVLFLTTASLRTTGTGDIRVTGTADLPSRNAIHFFSSVPQTWMETSHGDANIILTAPSGDLDFNGGTIGSATMQGDIRLITDDVSFAGTELLSQGNLRIKPYSNNTAINFGNGNVNDLAVTDSFITQLQDGFNQIVIGDSVKTSTVAIGTVTLDDSLVVRGSEIDVQSITSVGNTVTLDAGTIILSKGDGLLIADEFVINGKLAFAPGETDLTFTSDLTFSSGGSLELILDSDPPPSAPLLNVDAGTLTPADAELLLDQSQVNSYTPSLGDEIVLIEIGGGAPVAGAFAGGAEGSLIEIAGQNFRLSYQGGDGNDVTLVATDEPAVTAELVNSGFNAGNEFTVKAKLTSYLFDTSRLFRLYRTTDLTQEFQVVPDAIGVMVDHFRQATFIDPNPPEGQAFYQVKVVPEDEFGE